MEREITYKYRVVIHIKEDEFWDEQELIRGEEFFTPGEAAESADKLDLSRYPAGSYTYIESMFSSNWGRVGV